jgi:AraC-like DNA-binding protein
LPGGQILYFYENNFLPFYKTYNPPASLNKIIREFQVYHANWNEENNLPPPFITCLANTEQNLYFYLKDPVKLVIAAGKEIPVPPAVVTGPKYKTVGLLFGKEHTINNGLNAAEFWGDDVNKLVEQLKQNISYDSMIEIVCRFIEQRFDQSCRCEEPIDDVAIQMLDPLKNYTLEEWAAMACLSLRQFERNFITRVGISPKLFIRIVRFEYAMKIKNDYPEKNWSEIALECGYTDSSHLLKEFKEFAEFPPSRFYLQPTSGYSEFPTG